MQAGREIKFRAWHKEEKRMIDPVIGLNFEQPTSIIEWYETIYDAIEGVISDAFMDEVVLMQFTGLRDKNGKEIYEGDILQNITNSDFLRAVKWLAPSFVKEPIDKWSIERGIQETILFVGATYEVVGNIYENHELLEVGK